MGSRRPVLVALIAVGALVATACADAEMTVLRSQAAETTLAPAPTTSQPAASTTSTVAPPNTTTTTTIAPVPATAPTTTTTTTTTTSIPIDREVVDTGYSPYAVAGPLTLYHPVARAERIGFHQANHDGAQEQHPTAGAARAFVMESRGRNTGPRTAADVVAEPGAEVRAPVSGVVNRASVYTLYCDVTDEFLVINPDEAPYLEVKLLHVQGLTVGAGDRVLAAETVVARQAHALPFESQIDRDTAEPSWPHVHIEVVDPRIPNRPNPGSGHDC